MSRSFITQAYQKVKSMKALTPPSPLQVSVCVIVGGCAGECAASRSHCALVQGG